MMGSNYSIATTSATTNYCFYAAANHIRGEHLSCHGRAPRNHPKNGSRLDNQEPELRSPQGCR
ncbi:hypothetical protein KSP40_PGU021743 [Platanthera guangdongensis]|uniref:Uncharacterized protein n=1 Tax=Platanthera guangdongensis TaxID=2320717 RepID=A0ABR2N160_9ASPA